MKEILNVQEILITADGEEYVAIKPICEHLGVNHRTQLNAIKSDEILSSVVALRATTGADGKVYEMQVLPLKYVFGWLFTISPKNVKEEAREGLIQYRQKVYDILWGYFSESKVFLKAKAKMVEEELARYEEAKNDFSGARTKMKEAEARLNEVRKLSMESWKVRQLSLLDDEKN